MSVHAALRSEAGLSVLALSGVADENLLLRLADGVAALAAEVAEAIVVEVNDLVLSDVKEVRAFLDHLAEGSDGAKVVFACQRLSGRRLLRRYGGDRLRVYPSATDAAGALACTPA
jgi:hypothetical protein